jgi:hypothetical protein
VLDGTAVNDAPAGTPAPSSLRCAALRCAARQMIAAPEGLYSG